MAAEELIRLEIADGVATLTLNRPETRNALPKGRWLLLHEHLPQTFQRSSLDPILIWQRLCRDTCSQLGEKLMRGRLIRYEV